MSTAPGHTYVIDAPLGGGETQSAACQKLLGYILAQALQDGMSRIALGVRRDEGAVYLRYWGPRESEEARWWEMSAPPAEAYNGLAKAVVEAASFTAGVKPLGVIEAEINGRRVTVAVEMRAWDDLLLTLPGA